MTRVLCRGDLSLTASTRCWQDARVHDSGTLSFHDRNCSTRYTHYDDACVKVPRVGIITKPQSSPFSFLLACCVESTNVSSHNSSMVLLPRQGETFLRVLIKPWSNPEANSETNWELLTYGGPVFAFPGFLIGNTPFF